MAWLLSLSIFVSLSIYSKAEEITPTPSSSNSMTLNEFMQNYGYDLYSLEAYFMRRSASFPNPYGSNTVAFNAFSDYLEEKAKGYLLTDNTITVDNNITVSGGRGFNASEELRQEMINFVNETYIDNNNLTYKTAYIKSANYIDVTQFNTYAFYDSVKSFILSSDCYCFVTWNNGYNNLNFPGVDIWTVPKDLDIGFIGNVVDGFFSNVGIYINWQYGDPTSISSRCEVWHINPDGSRSKLNNSPYSFHGVIRNTNNIYNGNMSTIYTNLPDSELVYVFETLNAYKQFNTGSAQPYYVPSDPTDIAPLSDPFSLSDLTNASSYYNNIVDNSVSGMSGEEVIKLVDLILNNNGSGSGSGGSGSDNTHIWSSIGEAIGSLITGIATVVSKVAEALSNAILSIINIFVGDDGLFSKLTDLVDTGFSNFLSSVFSWLPPEIVTLFSATLIFGIFFAIWKMLRG